MKRPGRPRLDANDASAQVSVKMPSKQLAALCQRAELERRTVPDLIRTLLAMAPPKREKET